MFVNVFCNYIVWETASFLYPFYKYDKKKCFYCVHMIFVYWNVKFYVHIATTGSATLNNWEEMCRAPQEIHQDSDKEFQFSL